MVVDACEREREREREREKEQASRNRREDIAIGDETKTTSRATQTGGEGIYEEDEKQEKRDKARREDR